MPVALTELSHELEPALKAVRNIAASHRVARLEAFGSAATGRLQKTSDVDLLVVFEPMSVQEHGNHYFGLKYDLEDALGRPVDLVELKAVTNPYFLAAIEAERVLLYDA